MKRKLLSLFLTVALLVTMIPGFSITSSAAEVTDVLDLTFTGRPSTTSYGDWSNKTGTSGAVYAGQSAGDKSSIQLRSNNNNSGIVTTTSGGKVKSITVTWHADTASGRVLDIYGKNSAYSAATDLYNTSSQGTLLGSIARANQTSLTVSGDYEYIGLRSHSGAMYLTSVSIVWDNGQSSGGGDTPAHGDHDYQVKGVGENLYHTLECKNEVGDCNLREKTEACKDDDLDRLCDKCGADMSPATIVSVAHDTLASGASLPGTYTLEGTITSIDVAYTAANGFATLNIAVKGVQEPNNILKCYKLNPASGMTEAIQELAVGDDITVTGSIKNYNGTFEFDAGSKLIAFTDNTVHEHHYVLKEANNDGTHTLICDGAGTCGLLEKTEDCIDEDENGVCDVCSVAMPVKPSIKVGDQIVFIAADYAYEMTSVGTYGVATAYVDTPNCDMVLTVVAGAESCPGTFAFKYGDNYLYWGSGNSLSLNATLDEHSSWTVSFKADGTAVVSNEAGKSENRQIRWNNNKDQERFATYKGTMADIKIYKVPEVVPAIVERSVTLGASLAWSIWATLDTAKYPDAVLTATLNGRTETFAFSEAETGAKGFKFTYTDVVPAEVADEITVTILAAEGGDALIDPFTFNLYNYLLEVKDEYPEYAALINALLGYCAEAQEANGKTPITVPTDAAELVNPGTKSDEEIKPAGFTGVPETKEAAEALDLGETGYFKSATALNKNITFLRFEYVGAADHFTIKKGANGDEVTATLKNGKYIETEGLMPTEFGTEITVTAYTAGNEVISAVVYSVNTYCKRMNANGTDTYSLNLYNYGLAASALK